MLNNNVLDKFKAGGLHLVFSLFLASVSLYLIYCIWYPTPLAVATGVNQIFLMMLGIDVLLGPILTFIIYKKGKKTLKFDLAIVILMQVSALCYGVYSIAQGRPVWIVYTNERFELVRNNEIVQDHIEKAQFEFQKPSLLKPQYAAVKYANDSVQKSNDIFTETMGGVSLAQFPERYQLLNSVRDKIQNKSQSIDVLNQFNEKQQVANIIKKYPTATAWLPLKANAVDMVVLINKEKGEVVKIVDLRPWK